MRFKMSVAAVLAWSVLGMSAGSAAARPLRVTWMRGVAAPGTPAGYDRVGVIKVGRPRARNVLVLEPGTSAGAAYFVPLARWIVQRRPRWQVWAVERRENLLEDQSVLDRAKAGRASSTEVFDYYLGWLKSASITRHIHLIPLGADAFAKSWGMSVAVGDLRRVILAARRAGGRVVLGGHSLGGAVVTAYATWNFGGRPGAGGLAGLLYDDGGSFAGERTATARRALDALRARTTSPWLAFGGIPAPYAGLFNATGSMGALMAPGAPSLGQSSGILQGARLAPSVPVTNLGEYGYALNVGTSPATLAAAQAHLGRGLATAGHHAPYGWSGAGALTPIRRFATMFAGPDVRGADGTEWYFPTRLTIDSAAIDNGIAYGAQRVLGEKAVFGRRLPASLRIYAFGAALAGPGSRLMHATRMLARQSHIPTSHLLLVNRPAYAHNDPAGAYPHNVFFSHLMTFLTAVGRG